MKIVTRHVYPPIPIRCYDWMAIREDYDEGHPQGWGATEAEAISDLTEQIQNDKPDTPMTKEHAIITAKQFRKDADELLQRMKAHKVQIVQHHSDLGMEDAWETIAQHTLSIRDLESCIMRQGMALKYVGNPNPYPDSKDPSNTVVNPTADGLKM